MEDKVIEFCKQNEIKYVFNEKTLYIKAIDIAKVLNLSNIREAISKFDQNEKKKFLDDTKSGKQKCAFLSINGLKKLITNSRKLDADNIAKKIGIEILNHYCIPIEISSIKFIMNCFKDENMIHQYRVGIYRIDLYFPTYKIAVECDEKHHQKNLEKDAERQKYIEDKIQCCFIRYSPCQDTMIIAEVINQIHKIILSTNIRQEYVYE